MFDAVEIGRRISRLRKEKDMTQPALADLMGVSFQAVSNWERGASMPDIGKLPELAQTLGVSVDELLGGGRSGELIRSVIAGKEEAFVREEGVTLAEAGEAAPLLKPKQVTRIVRAIEGGHKKRGGGKEDSSEGNGNERIDFDALLALAPFLDEDDLDELAKRLSPEHDLDRLVAIAPFLSEETLGRLVDDAVKSGEPFDKIAALAPFLDEDDLGKIAAEAVKHGGTLAELASLAPFLDEDDLGKIAVSCVQSGGGAAQTAAIAPFLDEDDLDRIVREALKNGQKIGDLAELFPFLSQETLRTLVEEALKRNDTAGLSSITKFL